jgi:glycosyltransferase involved in cell wall biosynthesis
MVQPDLTIAVPTLKRAAYLQEAVDSALKQQDCRIEVLISQDLLPDGTLDPATESWSARCAADHECVRYLAPTQRLGLAGNWNRVMEAAQGEFLTIIGDDDRLLPAFASTLLAHRDRAEVVFANHHVIDARGERLAAATAEATRRFYRDGLQQGEQVPAAACVWRNAVPMSASIIHTATARRHRFADHLNTPDIEFFARVAAAGARFYFCLDYLAEYRVHPQSATVGGLTMAALVTALEPIVVPPELEPVKASLLAGFGDAMLWDGIRSREPAALRRACASPHTRSRLARAIKIAARTPVVGTALIASLARAYRAARPI